jgi:hypothetical protein
MASRPTRHEPAWTGGNGGGMEARQGAMRIFIGGGGCVALDPVRSALEVEGRTALKRDLENQEARTTSAEIRMRPPALAVKREW